MAKKTDSFVQYECVSCGAVKKSIDAKGIGKCEGCGNNDWRLLAHTKNLNPPKKITDKFSFPDALCGIKNVFQKYIDTSDSNISLLSHWVLGTYFHSQFETFPLGYLLAQKQSGKTRTLKLCSSLCANGDGSLTASLTETHLFRRKNKPAFFDELESINNKEQSSLRELLNASYKRGSKITRYREKKGNYEEEVFAPFYPIMIANISGLNDVLGDRAIEIVLRRSDKSQTLLIEDYSTNLEILDLKKKLGTLKAKMPENLFTQWNSFVQGKKIKSRSLIPFFNKIRETQINGRSLEIFFPLFIVAHFAKDLDDFLLVAQQYIQSKQENELVDNFDERLKKFIYAQQESYSGFVELQMIVTGFRQCVESPEVWINSKWTAKALKRLDLIAQKRLINGRTQVRLKFNINESSVTSTNPINPINPIISTNSTKIINNNPKLVEQVEKVEEKEQIDMRDVEPSSYPLKPEDKPQAYICCICGMTAVITIKHKDYCKSCAYRESNQQGAYHL